GRGVSQANHQAGVLLAVLDQLCQRWVLVLCLDEIFFHREPILIAVEPHSLAWVGGQRGPDRSGESWGDLVAKWPFVERVVADAGKGIERGVKLANEARANEAQECAAARPIEMGLDVFHTQRELQRIVHGQWRRAEQLIEAAAQADAKVARSQHRGRDARGVAKQAWWAWRKAEERVDAAAAQIETALALFRPEGCLSDRQWAQGQICAALAELYGQQWGKVRRLLSDPRTLNHLDWVHKQLTQAVEEPLLREAAPRLWDWREAVGRARVPKRVHLAQLVVIEQVVCQRLSPQWHQAYERVGQIVRGVVRASSAVEGLN